MTEKQTFILAHPEARRRAVVAVSQAPEGYCVQIKPPGRTLSENALLHALLGEIAATQQWAGKLRDIETWKRLLTAAWCRATHQQIELLPALDGRGVDIVYRPTSQLSKAECAELISFIEAWQAENTVTA